MQLNGSVLPPRPVLVEVADAVLSARRQAESPAVPKRGLFGRRAALTDAAADVQPFLVDVPIDAMQLPITGFGNLTADDANRLVDALGSAAADWAVPMVRFAGGTALEFPGDRSVWAVLDGDLEALATMARAVTTCVEQLGLFVDRRVFRPMLSVATVTESTTGPDLDAVVAALNALRGELWSVDTLVLTTATFDRHDTSVREVQRIPIG